MGIVSGGGGTFNGGTITAPPLTVLETNGTSKGIVINTQGGFGVNALEIDAPHTTFTVDGDGVVSLTSDDTLGVQFAGTSGTPSTLTVRSIGATNSVFVELDTSQGVLAKQVGAAATTLFIAEDHTNALVWQATDSRFSLAYHAAPADGDLSAGDCALWFDQTNGSPALNVKGKQADGTVFSGLVTRLAQVSPKGVITSGALSTVQLVTATGAQILTTRDAETITPCTFNPGAATTATVTVALSPDNVTYSTLGVETEPAGVAFDGTIHLVKVRVPAGWYLKLTVNAQAVLGLTTYY